MLVKWIDTTDGKALNEKTISTLEELQSLLCDEKTVEDSVLLQVNDTFYSLLGW